MEGTGQELEAVLPDCEETALSNVRAEQGKLELCLELSIPREGMCSGMNSCNFSGTLGLQQRQVCVSEKLSSALAGAESPSECQPLLPSSGQGF